MIFTEILSFIILSSGALVIGFWILVFTFAILYFVIDILLNIYVFIVRSIIAIPIFIYLVIRDFIKSKLFPIYFIMLLVYSCSSNKLTSNDVQTLTRLSKRCEIEFSEILKIDGPMSEKYCQCHLTSLADGKFLEEQGKDAAIKRLNDYYIISTDLARAIMSEDQERVNRFPASMIRATGVQMDKCLDQAKSYFYEIEINQKIDEQMKYKNHHSNNQINFVRCKKKLKVCRVG